MFLLKTVTVHCNIWPMHGRIVAAEIMGARTGWDVGTA